MMNVKMRIIFLLHLKHYMRFFWQSIKKTKKLINLLIIMIKLLNLKIKYNVKFSILNDTDGGFELRLFEDQYKDNKVDINHFIERKREYEVKK